MEALQKMFRDKIDAAIEAGDADAVAMVVNSAELRELREEQVAQGIKETFRECAGSKSQAQDVLFRLVGRAIADALRACDRLDISSARRRALEKRIEALEAKVGEGLQYEGVHEPGRAYRHNVATTHSGSIWISKRATTDTPGDSDAWVLAVKRGKDAR